MVDWKTDRGLGCGGGNCPTGRCGFWKGGGKGMYLSSGYTKNVNKYQTLFILVIVRVLCVFTNYKTIENIDVCSWRTLEKNNQNEFNFILYSHSQLLN